MLLETVCIGIFTSVVGNCIHSWLSKGMRRLNGDEFDQKINAIAEAWRQETLNESSDYEAIFKIADSLHSNVKSPSEVINRIGQKLECKQIPTKEEWRNALLEQWRAIRDSRKAGDLQDFFNRPECEVKEQFESLAEKFITAYQGNSEYGLPGIFLELKTILNAVHSAYNHIPGTVVPSILPESINLDPPTPSKLLQAKNRVVPFVWSIRQEERKYLEQFCRSDDKDHQHIRLFTGPGGSGKTRLLYEWCIELQSNGWRTFFVTPHCKIESIRDILRFDYPVCLVFDYAECHTNLKSFFEELLSQVRSFPHAVSIALIGRHDGDWWESLHKSNEDNVTCTWGVLRLQNIPLEEQIRSDFFHESFCAFANILPDPHDFSVVPTTLSLTNEIFQNPLYIQMAAYNAVFGDFDTAKNPLDAIVDREKKFWIKYYKNADTQHIDDDDLEIEKRLSDIVAAITLRGGISDDLLANLVGQNPGIGNDRLIIKLLSKIYGFEDDNGSSVISGLEPDLLGERFVFEVLSSKKNSACDFIFRAINQSSQREMIHCFISLGHIWENSKNQNNVSSWIDTLLTGSHLNHFFLPATLAAIALGEQTAFCPIPDILYEKLREDSTVEQAQILVKCLPWKSISFSRLNYWAAMRFVRSTSHFDKEPLSNQASILLRLAASLSYLGKYNDAILYMTKSVQLYRILENKDSFSHRIDLAGSLLDLAYMYADIEDYQRAIKLSDEAKTLLERHKDPRSIYLFGLLHNNKSNWLSNIGEFEKALEESKLAVEFALQKVAVYEGSYLSELACAYNNLGNHYLNCKRPEEALKATEKACSIFEQLLGKHNDSIFGEYGNCLYNLAIAHYYLECYEKAFHLFGKALVICRDLARKDVEEFKIDYAAALNNYAIHLSDAKRTGRTNDDLLSASKMLHEAIEILEGLDNKNSNRHLRLLGDYKSTLSNVFSELGQKNDFFASLRESIETHKKVASQLPKIVLGPLARNQHCLANRLYLDNQFEQALIESLEAVNTYQKIQELRIEYNIEDFKTLLNTQRAIYESLGRYDEVAKIQEEINRLESDESGD